MPVRIDGTDGVTPDDIAENPEDELMFQPYFITKGTQFEPTKLSRGYWIANSITGSAIASLLAYCLERDFGAPDLVITRFNVDLLGLIKAEPLSVETQKLKDGRRLKLAEARIYCDGQLMARANCQFVLKTENPENATWQTPAWDAPLPDDMGPPLKFGPWDLLPVAPNFARIARDSWTAPASATGNAPVLGPLAKIASRQAWFRPNNPAVDAVPMSPFLRAAMVADFVSPIANSSEQGIDYINTDLTLYLHREPVGAWMGLELVGHRSCAGISVGECWLHDVEGPLGTVNLSATAQIRKKVAVTPGEPAAARQRTEQVESTANVQADKALEPA